MVRHRTCNSKYAVNISLILTNPSIGQLGQSSVLVGKMPDIQRGRSLRTHFTSNARRLVTVVGPGFLITKDLIVLGGALGVNFLVKNRLLTDIGKDREIVVQTVLTRPETLKALLIGMVITSNHNTNHKAMLNKRLDKIAMHISCDRESSSITKRSSIGLSCRALYHLIDINRDTITAKILRTLEASIGRSNAKMRLEDFNIPSASSCILFIKFLHLKSHAELVDSGSGNRTVIDGPKIGGDKKISITASGILRSPNGTGLGSGTLVDTNDIIGHFIKSLNTEGGSRRTRNFFRQSLNGIICTTRNRDSHIRTFLRSRQRRSEVVMELSGLEGHAAFDNISDIVGTVGTSKGSVIHGDIERVRKILITKPLIHNERIGTERQRVNK